MQEGATSEAVGPVTAGGTVVCRVTPVAADSVLRLVAERWVVDTELGVVEDVKCLGAELGVDQLANSEMLEERDIHVQAVRIV